LRQNAEKEIKHHDALKHNVKRGLHSRLYGVIYETRFAIHDYDEFRLRNKYYRHKISWKKVRCLVNWSPMKHQATLINFMIYVQSAKATGEVFYRIPFIKPK